MGRYLWFISPITPWGMLVQTWRNNKQRPGSSLPKPVAVLLFRLMSARALSSAGDDQTPEQVIGSDPLERQIRELGSDVHIFGHTHIPIDMTSDGVRYVQWPLGEYRILLVLPSAAAGGGGCVLEKVFRMVLLSSLGTAWLRSLFGHSLVKMRVSVLSSFCSSRFSACVRRGHCSCFNCHPACKSRPLVTVAVSV